MPATVPPSWTAPTSRTGNLGCTEDQVSMTGTVAQRIDHEGSKIEELAGTGEYEAPGG